MDFRIDPSWAALLIALPFWAALVWWNLSIGFCGYLEKKIDQGKILIYVPIRWNRRRALWRPLHKVLHCLTAVVTAGAVWAGWFPEWPLAFPPLLVVSSLLVWLLKKRLQRRRYSQQATLYFDRLRDHFDLAQKTAKKVTEAEVKNRVSWAHQQLMLRADERGFFLLMLAGKRALPELSDGEDR